MVDVLRRRAGVVLGVGCALVVLGLLGFVFDWGSSSSVAQPVAVGTASSASSSPSSASAPATETPESFFAAFTTAIRTGDTGFLVDRMHSFVIDRYGTDQCTAFAPNLIDPGVDLHIVGVDGPKSFDYSSDGRSVLVPDTYAFHVDGTSSGSTGPRDYHFALVDGRYRLFVDCGNPVK